MKIIYNYIAAHVSSTEDIKDIVQETMFSAWKAIGGFDKRSSFKTWVLGITRRKIADYYRASYRDRTVPLNDCEEYTADDEFEHVIDRTDVGGALASLDSTDREIVFLIFNAQLSYGEISSLPYLSAL